MRHLVRNDSKEIFFTGRLNSVSLMKNSNQSALGWKGNHCSYLHLFLEIQSKKRDKLWSF